jgi:transposase
MSGLGEILAENSRLRDDLRQLGEASRQTLRQKDETLRQKDETLRQKDETLRQKDEVIETQAVELTKTAAMLEALKAQAEELARQLELIKLKVRGPASQRFIPDEQDVLPFPGDIEPPPRAPKPEPDDQANGAKTDQDNKKKPRRRSRDKFGHMKSRNVTCKAPKEQPCASCKRPLGVVGQADSFRVEWVPGHFVVEDVHRDKLACPNPECPDFRAVLTVPAPYALPRALCGDALLARVIIDKHADHIPLNRQAKRMAREGFGVGSNTLAGWMLKSGSLLKHVALAVRTDLLKGPFIQADDTGHPVQDAGDGTLRKGRMWVFTDQQQAFYAFTPTKEGHFPADLISGFAGDLLLVDGGSEFNQAVREHDLQRGGCWSHLRTYFHDARHYHPVEATLALGTIRDLHMIERTLRGLEPEQIVAQRQALAKPLVDGFFAWVQAVSTSVRPKSGLGDAIRYARNQEKALRLYLEHGELPMHNNLSELMLRQNVVGRKNWLFSRSEGGAEVAGYMYTLVGSCMLQGIDPHDYLIDILSRLPDHPATRAAELTPKAWRLAKKGHTTSDV